MPMFSPEITNQWSFDYTHILSLKQNHSTLRLIAAETAPLIISFCYQAFIGPNRRTIAEEDLETLLADYLFQLRDAYGENLHPKTAREYLDDWSSETHGYLRKYYPRDTEEAEFDLTPATEKAIEWLQGLRPKEFIGAETRLLMIVQLLRDLRQLTETDIQVRLEALEKQKQTIELAITDLKNGITPEYQDTQVKERFIQAEETAYALLGDFRQIDYNFRQLDRETRERIVLSEQEKGEVLDEVFAQHDAICDSDQGKSFQAFWEFLMSPERQTELAELLDHVYQQKEVKVLGDRNFLKSIAYSLLDAGERVYKTSQSLSHQLRQFLDQQAYLENKRMSRLMADIEKKAIESKEKISQADPITDISSFKIEIQNIMQRSLYEVTKKTVVNSQISKAQSQSANLALLFQQHYVDESVLLDRIQQQLQSYSQFSLKQLISFWPIEKGLAEIVAYLKIASEMPNAYFDEAAKEVLVYDTANQLAKTAVKAVTVAKIMFVREK